MTQSTEFPVSVEDVVDVETRRPAPDDQVKKRSRELAELKARLAEELEHDCPECMTDLYIARLLELLDAYSLPVEVEELLKQREWRKRVEEAALGHSLLHGADVAEPDVAATDEMSDLRHEIELLADELGWQQLSESLTELRSEITAHEVEMDAAVIVEAPSISDDEEVLDIPDDEIVVASLVDEKSLGEEPFLDEPELEDSLDIVDELDFEPIELEPITDVELDEVALEDFGDDAEFEERLAEVQSFDASPAPAVAVTAVPLVAAELSESYAQPIEPKVVASVRQATVVLRSERSALSAPDIDDAPRRQVARQHALQMLAQREEQMRRAARALANGVQQKRMIQVRYSQAERERMERNRPSRPPSFLPGIEAQPIRPLPRVDNSKPVFRLNFETPRPASKFEQPKQNMAKAKEQPVALKSKTEVKRNIEEQAFEQTEIGGCCPIKCGGKGGCELTSYSRESNQNIERVNNRQMGIESLTIELGRSLDTGLATSDVGGGANV